MGLPIAGMSGGIPMAVGMPPGMMGMLPHFSQASNLHILICLAMSADLCYYQTTVMLVYLAFDHSSICIFLHIAFSALYSWEFPVGI